MPTLATATRSTRIARCGSSIHAGIAGCHIEDQTFPPKSGARRRCISTQEMVGKLKAAMDAKMELDPDFVIMARCDFGGVPGATFAEIIERCLAYKEEARVDVVCPNDLKSWDEIQEALLRIPGPVVPLIPASIRPYPRTTGLQGGGGLVPGADDHGRSAGQLGLPERF